MITPIKIPFVCLANDDAALKAKREELKKKLLEGKKIPISPTGSVTTGTNEGAGISIPPGKLANDDAALKAKREELKKKLLEGKKIPISPTGSVTTGTNEGAGISIPPGKLANDDAALKAKREELKKKLLEGKKIPISPTGSVTTGTNEGSGISIPPGKLAMNQWYEKSPLLLEAEKAAMEKYFPFFTLDRMDDGRLAWSGELSPGALGNSSWYVQAVYNNNHPQQVMGSSVRVYLISPDIEELIDGMGWTPTHLLRDSDNQLFLCTAGADDIKTGKQTTSAASVIGWAVKWLLGFELVMTGDLSKEKFNEHGGI
jgi:hypothetical protein